MTEPLPPDPADADRFSGIVRTAAQGAAWNYVVFGVGRLLSLLTTAILARLLVPEDFGLVALASVAVGYLSVLKDFGLGAALIQRPDDTDATADTVFTWNLILGIALTGTTFFVAPLVADFFAEPRVTPLLRALGWVFVLNSLGTVHSLRLLKELEFKKKLLPDLAQSVVKGVTSVGLALGGAGVWALVGGQLVGVVAFVGTAWIVRPWLPRLTLAPGLARKLLRFGIAVLGIDALTVVNDSLDYVIVGRMIGSVELGIYTLAYRIPEMLVMSLLWVVATVAFPTFSALQTDPASVRRAFLGTTRYVSLIVAPMSIGLALTADPLVRVVWGEQWIDAIPVLRLLAVYVLIRSIGYHVGGIYKAMGKPRVLVGLGLLSLVVLLPSLLIGSLFGLVGVAIGHVVAAFIRTLIRLVAAQRLLRLRWSSILRETIPALAASAVLVAVAGPILVATQGLSSVSRLLIVIPSGVVAYLGTAALVDRESLTKAVGILRRHRPDGRRGSLAP